MRILTLCWLALVLPMAVGQEAKRPIVLDDYFTQRTITEFAAQNGAVVYSLATWDKADDARKGDLWFANPAWGTKYRLTFDRANDRHIRWTKEHIYFLGNRKREAETKPPYDGKTQVWRISPDGSGLMAVTKIPGGVTSYDIAKDHLIVSVDVEHADDDDFAKLRAKYAKNEYGHGIRKVSQLHRLDLNTWVMEKLPTETRYIREFAVSPDGERIAMISAFDDTIVKSEGESRVDIWQNGKTTTPPTEVYRAKASSPHAWLENLTWSVDSKKFAFVAVHDAFPAEVILGDLTSETPVVSRVPRDGWQVVGYGRATGAPVQFNKEGKLLIQTEANGLVGAGLYDPAVRGFTLVKTTGNVTGLSADQDFQLVSTESSFPELKFRGQAITDLNPQARNWQLPEVKHIRWKAPDGTMVGGVLELPHGYKPGTKLPLVVGIHGGPTTATKADLAFDPHNGRLYWTLAGYAVLQPNYRGSTGYGDKFLTDLVGNENDIEVKDILAGIQHLVKEGIADPERIGCMGWSNGGYLTNCLITLKDSPVKFKAASSGAGILDTVAEWGFNDEPAYPIVFKKGLPWEQPEIYKKTSPTYGLANVTTPTIIHVGAADERCPPGHSRMLYRALKEYKNVPTELILYTGEPHGLSKASNRKAKMEFDLAWFAKYLK
ncbi:MAG: prolyl oligopeptidase family serine peptidase [Fimbriiglobus sp.]